jgi:hypothetical protein
MCIPRDYILLLLLIYTGISTEELKNPFGMAAFRTTEGRGSVHKMTETESKLRLQTVFGLVGWKHI